MYLIVLCYSILYHILLYYSILYCPMFEPVNCPMFVGQISPLSQQKWWYHREIPMVFHQAEVAET